jgi:hypothetical protein
MAEFNEEIPQEKLTVTEAVARLKLIQQGLAIVVANLHENIQALDDDLDFQDTIEKLQKNTENRARDLEIEVKRLRTDVKTIKDLLGESADKKNPTDS